MNAFQNFSSAHHALAGAIMKAIIGTCSSQSTSSSAGIWKNDLLCLFG